MTAEEWKQVEDALKSLFKKVELKIDDYTVELCLAPISTYKNAIVVYVNGKVTGRWLMEDCEERRRFMHMRSKSNITTKTRNLLKKQSKKFQKEFLAQYEKQWNYYEPYWQSFNAMKTHFIKNNTDITFVKC